MTRRGRGPEGLGGQMEDWIGFAVEQGVACLTLQPAACALSAPARTALMEAIDRAEEEDGVTAILILAPGDVALRPDPDDPALGQDEPALRDLCDRIEFCELPVVLAFGGDVLDGGAEFALAAHHCLAAAGARIGFGGIALGLPPGAGATQRLPRALGAEIALGLLLGGRLVPVAEPRLAPLIDGLAEMDSLRDSAIAFCGALDGPRRLRDSRAGFDNMQAYQAAIQARRTAPALAAPEAASRVLDLVEAAPLVPFEMGQAMEAEAFAECAAGPESRALRHLDRAERSLAVAPAAEVGPVAVLGGSALGVQLVLMLLEAGMAVQWGATDADRLARAQAALADLVRQRRSPEAASDLLGRLTCGPREDMIAGAGIVLLATPGQADQALPEGIIAARVAPGAVDRLGLRFPTPPRSGRIVEILEGPEATEAEIAAAHALAARLRRLAVPQRTGGGCVSARLAATLHRAVDGLVDAGADPIEIDTALTSFGLRQGPFLQRDILGLAAFAEAPRGEGARNWSSELLQYGRHGRESQRGFYLWPDSDRPTPDPALRSLLDGMRPHQAMPADRIVSLVLGALANEGLRLLEAGMARSAADIDVVSVHALGLPRVSGGIMHAVGTRGLFAVEKAMERLDHPDAEFWRPLPAWVDRIKNGQTFDGL
ncbi:enoyl-CoA hydratase/isomerase family protein [Thetidibacter halocola]|uniref:Enoyl-CoA hydratase n=1 Tax=Thetidibacter halocola TaxID=2827239 RepID=A0A8J7WKK2_9RHOB|nr:enoyl-CoA hydratase/isomerase family protein [Thetidibacter halocola]MBS0126733.1 enoyl-CoA hydratase [Thetidibacter halocola]